MPTIVKLSGTSGSGKSTIAHYLLSRYPHEVVRYRPSSRSSDRPEAYKLHVEGKQLLLIGGYTTQCGGCDGIQPYSRIIDRLNELTTQYPKAHVLMEGLLIYPYGSLGEAMDKLKPKYKPIHAYMDTPLALCLERINQRRAKKGKTEPVNPKNTEQKWNSVQVRYLTLMTEGHNVAWINHKKPVSSVLDLYGIAVKEPRWP